MPNFNFLTVDETREAAKKRWEKTQKTNIAKVAKEKAVKNNAKRCVSRTSKN